MIESSASRRLSRPRLTLAVVLLSGVIAVAFAGWRIVKSVTAWVAEQPDQQIWFNQIDLIPDPDPWLIGGELKILEEVRTEAGYPEKLSLLSLNLKTLQNDFRRCPWVKDVKVERFYGRLAVHLVYRKPVAIVVPKAKNGIASVIDGEAVVLPWLDVHSSSDQSQYRVRDIPTPLIHIREADISTPPRVGVPWSSHHEGKSADDLDSLILRAARLAEFLQEKSSSPTLSRDMPRFVSIWLPGEPSGPFFLLDSQDNWVTWGKAPGDEKAGELSSEARWKMLIDYVKRYGPIHATRPDRIYFTRTEAVLFRGKP